MLTSFEKRPSSGARKKKTGALESSECLLLEAEVPIGQDEVRGTQHPQEEEGVRNVLKSLVSQVPKGKDSEVAQSSLTLLPHEL